MDTSSRHSSQQRTHRGPAGLGGDAASYLGAGHDPGEGIGGIPPEDGRQQTLLREWAESRGCLIKEDRWASFKLVSQATSEHEVRFDAVNSRAWKRTWPGTFGFVPHLNGTRWELRTATPLQYLARLNWQNELFGDDLRVEGVMISNAPSMIIGQPSGCVSLIISQPWLKGMHLERPHPSETEIATIMQEQGFDALFGAFYGWQRKADNIIVTDARPDNFIKTALGIMPIDLHITQAAPPDV